MLFKDLKPGYTIYLLNKGETIKAGQGKVISVSQPYFPQPSIGSVQPVNMQNMQRLVDVAVEYDGKNNTFAIPETLSIADANNLVLSTDRDGILRDVEALKNQSQEVVSSVAKHEGIIKQCDEILQSWNPVFAQKAAQDKKIENMEQRLEGLSSEIKSIGGILEKIAAKFDK